MLNLLFNDIYLSNIHFIQYKSLAILDRFSPSRWRISFAIAREPPPAPYASSSTLLTPKLQNYVIKLHPQRVGGAEIELIAVNLQNGLAKKLERTHKRGTHGRGVRIPSLVFRFVSGNESARAPRSLFNALASFSLYPHPLSIPLSPSFSSSRPRFLGLPCEQSGFRRGRHSRRITTITMQRRSQPSCRFQPLVDWIFGHDPCQPRYYSTF